MTINGINPPAPVPSQQTTPEPTTTTEPTTTQQSTPIAEILRTLAYDSELTDLRAINWDLGTINGEALHEFVMQELKKSNAKTEEEKADAKGAAQRAALDRLKLLQTDNGEIEVELAAKETELATKQTELTQKEDSELVILKEKSENYALFAESAGTEEERQEFLQLKAEIDAQIVEMEASIDTLKQEISSLESEISALQDRVALNSVEIIYVSLLVVQQFNQVRITNDPEDNVEDVIELSDRFRRELSKLSVYAALRDYLVERLPELQALVSTTELDGADISEKISDVIQRSPDPTQVKDLENATTGAQSGVGDLNYYQL